MSLNFLPVVNIFCAIAAKFEGGLPNNSLEHSASRARTGMSHFTANY